MPQSVLHFLSVVILLELFKDFFVKNKKNFPGHYLFIGGLAGLFPDFDFAAFYIMSFFGYTKDQIHRLYIHSLIIPILLILIAVIFYYFKNKDLSNHHLKLRNILFVVAFGISVHILLDYLISGGVALFYPFSTKEYSVNLINYLPLAWHEDIFATIDAIILIIWVIYLEIRHKISSVL